MCTQTNKFYHINFFIKPNKEEIILNMTLHVVFKIAC